MHVAGKVSELFICFYQNCFKRSLKQRSYPCPFYIEKFRIAIANIGHKPADAMSHFLPKDKVEMIGHEAIRKNRYPHRLFHKRGSKYLTFLRREIKVSRKGTAGISMTVKPKRHHHTLVLALAGKYHSSFYAAIIDMIDLLIGKDDRAIRRHATIIYPIKR